jgi:prepilin-type N-terminal cleavage/methylation domain-containing protein
VRRGFTLIEVLLVLAVVVMLAAFTVPALDRPMAGQRLKQAADRVRTEWIRARLKAMSTGDTYIFRYVPNDCHYSIEVQPGPESTLDSFAMGGGATLSGDGTEAGSALAIVERAIPEDCVFVDSETGLDTRADTVADTALASGPSDAAWSTPIIFYPDGTTSDARLVLRNKYDHEVVLSIRGLTGVVTVGDVVAGGGPLVSGEAMP